MKYVQTVPLVGLFLVMVYFAIFNWSVFTVSLNVSLGFGLVAVPLVAAVFLVGLFFLGLQTGLTYFIGSRRNLERTLKESQIGALKKEKDLEISALKASFYEEEVVQIKKNAERIAEIQSEMEKMKESLPREEEPGEHALSLPESDEKPDKD
ncbi:MAG: hypothetical protein WBG01_02910 [Bacteroidota bacterium]